MLVPEGSHLIVLEQLFSRRRAGDNFAEDALAHSLSIMGYPGRLPVCC
jgi:hypothetical protein